MTPALDLAIKATLCVCFPDAAANFSITRAWHGSGPAYCVVVMAEGAVVAHVGAVERILRVGSQLLRIAGVQNVCVQPQFRKQGLTEPMLAQAMAEAQRRGADMGLLFCLPALEKLYARCGWRPVESRPVTATAADGRRYRLDEHNILMFFPLAAQSFPPGNIDLNGDDW